MKRRSTKTWSTPVHDSEKETVPCVLCGGSVFIPKLKCEGFSFVRCKKCGLVQMNPQPVTEEITARYGTAYGKDYLDYEIENEANFLLLQKLALKDAGFSVCLPAAFPPASFLDVGCATGALLAYLREHGWRVTGVEISPSADYAIKTRGLDIKKQPLEKNKFEKEKFDIIHASHLIEHLKDPRSFLTEVHRLLKPQGCVYISTPNIAGFQACLFGNRWRSAIFDHLYLFSARTLKKLLKDTGFKVQCVSTWGGLAAGIGSGGAVFKRLKKIIDCLAKFFGFGDVMIIKAKKSAH